MHEIIERIGWVLVHSLWQFGLIAVLTGIVMRAMRRRSADARYAVLVAAMAVLIGFPVVTAFLLPRSASESSTRLERSQTSNSVDELGSPGGVIADGIPNAAVPVIINESAIDSPASTPPVAVADLTAANPIRSELSPSRLEQISALLRPWFTWIVAGWSLGVVLCSFRPLLGWQMLRRLKRYGISPVPHSIQAALNRVSVQMGMHQSVEVLLSSLAQVPIVVGYFKPAILLPISFVTHIPPAQVEAILAHELAHVGRHDFLVNLLQTLVETLFFYHPAVWWLSKRIRIEREHCCDDLVIRVLQNRVEYGRALVAVEELRGQTSVLALGASDGSMLARIRRIVGAGPDRTDFELSGRWPVAFLAVVMLGFVLKIGVDSFASAVTEGELRDASEPVVVEQNDKADVDEPANLISSAGADGAVAELPDGRFVEIVGITRNTRPASEGWRPDGGGIGDVGYWKSTIVLHQQNTVATYNENGPHPDPDANALDFLLRFRGLKSQPSIRFELPANGGSHHHWPVKDPYEFRVSARLRGEVHPGATWNPPDGVVRVALTDEPWGKWLQISPRGEILNPHNEGDLYQADYDDARVERVEPHDRAPDGRVLVLRQPKNYADRYDFQIRGIDTDGKEQWVLRWDGDAVNGTNLEDSRWGLATTETKPLSRYEFRLRPYRHRVTFENVSLRAGQVTKVTWKAESTPSELQTQREHVPEIAERVRAADPAPVELLRLFEGDWQVERCDSALPLLGADRFLARKWRWTINGNEILWRREGETWKLKFTVDPGKSPGEIDLQFLSGPFEGKHVLGVFEWSRGDENRLTIAIQNPGATVDRPRNFENKPNGQTSLIVLRSDLPIDPASERAAFERSWV